MGLVQKARHIMFFSIRKRHFILGYCGKRLFSIVPQRCGCVPYADAGAAHIFFYIPAIGFYSLSNYRLAERGYQPIVQATAVSLGLYGKLCM